VPRGLRVGRIGGVDIRVDTSLLLIATLITLDRWSLYSDRRLFPRTSPAAAIGLALFTAVLFFGSILAHELAHAGMARLRRIPVEGITLFMFGGATHARIESRGPVDEFLVTVVGPGTSLALGGLFFLLWTWVRGDPFDPVVSVFFDLRRANILLGLFNLAPGFPLDGGRLLRSVVWRVTGSLARATRVAGRAGQVVAVLIIAWSGYLLVRDQNILAIWPATIGLMLFRAATSSLGMGERQRLLEGATVAQAMSPPPPTVPAGIPVEEALHRFLVGHDGEAFPVVEGDRVVGYVSLKTIQGVPLDRPVREAMANLGGTVQARPQDRLDTVAERLEDSPTRTGLVLDNGTLVGVIEPEDVNRFLRRASGAAPNGRDGPSDVPPRPDAGYWPST
jgi:Zn-dependent protease/CBS domain-containing protein